MKEGKKYGPFTILDSKIKYENKWIKVVEESVLLPHGGKGSYGLIHAGRGVSVLPLDEEGNVYLQNEFRYGLGRDDILGVLGGVEDGETFEEAAKRELKEELGITAQSWSDFGYMHSYSNIMRAQLRLYIAKNLSFGDAFPEATEISSLVKISLKEAVDKVMIGEIQDASVSILLLKAWKLHLRK